MEELDNFFTDGAVLVKNRPVRRSPAKTKESPEEKEERIYQQYKEIVSERVDSLNVNFDKVVDGYQLRLLTNNAINAIVMMQLIMDSFDVEEIYICIYRMNQKSVEFLRRNIYEANIPAVILLSNFFRENRRYEAWFETLSALSCDEFKIKTGVLHAKIFTCRTSCGRHFVFEGSGNLSDNARIEQYMLEDNKHMFDFYKGFMESY